MTLTTVNLLSPTEQTYRDLQAAYDHFNGELFDGMLPDVLITIQRKGGTRGYFACGRFMTRDGAIQTDEVALNPFHFKGRSTKEILSTLVHELAHVWQYHFGKPGRGRYHNAEWARKMDTLGLTPTSTGRPGGRRTGDRVTHMIVAGGRFCRSCDAFLAVNAGITFVERWSEQPWKFKTSNLNFYCPRPNCSQSVTGKPDTMVRCHHHDELMISRQRRSSNLPAIMTI